MLIQMKAQGYSVRFPPIDNSARWDSSLAMMSFLGEYWSPFQCLQMQQASEFEADMKLGDGRKKMLGGVVGMLTPVWNVTQILQQGLDKHMRTYVLERQCKYLKYLYRNHHKLTPESNYDFGLWQERPEEQQLIRNQCSLKSTLKTTEAP